MLTMDATHIDPKVALEPKRTLPTDPNKELYLLNALRLTFCWLLFLVSCFGVYNRSWLMAVLAAFFGLLFLASVTGKE